MTPSAPAPASVSTDITRQPVVFPNAAGAQLFGLLDAPAAPTGDLGVILLSPGIKMRVGPHRLYRRMSDLFTSMGLPVFRFDFYGLGDSEGTIAETQVRDVYNHIEVGRFVRDTIDAMNWMERHRGTKRFILCGLCGGAVTGLLAGSKDPRVAGLLALGITPLLASRAADPALYMTTGQLERMQRGYIRKLLSPSSWLRLLTFQSDYRVIWKSMQVGFRPRKQAPVVAAPPPESDNASPIFPPAFFRMLETGRPMLLVFGGSDRLGFEFEEKFVARHRARLGTLPPRYEVHVVPRANHVISMEEWQVETLDVSTAWLRTHFRADLNPYESGEPAGAGAAFRPGYPAAGVPTAS